ncbi:MAG: beta-lactamase family protein, partial [Bacteroidales bacterium]|nr:beta-lactamase family protein [Bacteroidales bacterium]
MMPGKATATVFPGADWEEKSPESQNVDSQKLDDAMSYLAGECGAAGTDQVVVIRNGYMIWKGSDIDNMHNVWSTSKSFTSTVLGLLTDDGKCTLDTYAGDYLSDLSSQYPDIKLRHFASMTSGYDGVNHGDESPCQSKTPFDPTIPHFSPGSKFEYCDDAMNQFGNVLTRIAGENIETCFKKRIADPIGMNDAKWDWSDWGTIDGLVVNGGAGNKGRGIHISARELARFGLLFLNRGNWNGNQLISSSWVDQATRVQVPASVPESNGTYGFNWWVNGSEKVKWPEAPASTFAAEGYNNNHCFVIPDWNMVIVRLGKDGTVSDSVYSTFLHKVEDALITPALPGQVIVDPDHPQWLKYNGGGPFFMCGPGDPENFLYRGSRNSDGTRNGDQMALINKLKGTGANSVYLQIVRSHGGDGDSTHNPFTDSDPAKGINQDILDQWETWFDVLDENGIVIYLFFYDDGAHIWSGDTIGSGEKSFIQTIVNRFEHHKHLIWCVAEEYQEAYSVTCVKEIAKEIRQADDYNHAIAVHKLSGLSFSE